jgi:frataxin-like iron-binding protein CyaY
MATISRISRGFRSVAGRSVVIWHHARRLALLRPPPTRAIALAWPPVGRAREPLARGLAIAAGSCKGDASTELDRIRVALVDAFGKEQVAVSDGKIDLDLGAAIGCYSLSSETSGNPPIQKILLVSPVSGARWYEWDASNECWASPDDGHQLVELLVREVMHSTARYVNL